MDARLGILLEESYEQADRAAAEHEQKLTDGFNRLSRKHEDSTRQMGRHWDQYRAGALNSIKSVEEYRQEWSAKSTKVLEEHVKELGDKRYDETVKYRKGLAEANEVEIRIHKNRIEQLSLEEKALQRIKRERSDSATFANFMREFREVPGVGKISELASVFTENKALGIAAGVAATGVGLYELFHHMEEWAKSYENASDRVAIALTRTGLVGPALHRETEIVLEDAKKISNAMAIPRDEAAGALADVAAFGRVGGKNLEHLTELAIAAGHALGKSTQEVAQFIGKGANPEIEAQIARIGIHVEKGATQFERLNAIEKAYGATVEETKERMSEGAHQWDVLINNLTDARNKFAADEFKKLTPVFHELQVVLSQLGPDIKEFAEGFNEQIFDPAIRAATKFLKKFAEVDRWLKDHPIPLGSQYGSWENIVRFFKGEKLQTPEQDAMGGWEFGTGTFGEPDIKPVPVPIDKAKVKQEAFQREEQTASTHYANALRSLNEQAIAEINAGMKAKDVLEHLNEYKLQVEQYFINQRIAIYQKFGKDTSDLTRRFAEIDLQINAQYAGKRQEEVDRATAEREKKEVEAWQKHIDRLQHQFEEERKLEERRARIREEIQKKVEDRTDEAIANKYDKERAKENREYEREQRRILDQADGTKETRELIQRQLEELEKAHTATMDKISSDAEGDRMKRINAQWKDLNSELVKTGGNLRDILRVLGTRALGAALEEILTLAAPSGKSGIPSFHDSPLLSMSGAPRIGDKYLVLGDGDDRLVKGYEEGGEVAGGKDEWFAGGSWFYQRGGKYYRHNGKSWDEVPELVAMAAGRAGSDSTISAGHEQSPLEKLSSYVSQSKLGHGVSSLLSGFTGIGPGEEAQKNLDALTGVQGEHLRTLGTALGVADAGSGLIAHAREHGAKSLLKVKSLLEGAHAAHGAYELSGGHGPEEASTAGLIFSLLKSGFMDGEFTGHGNPRDAAGVVHKEEFVFSAPAVKNIGVENLRQWHRIARNGYMDGGLATDGLLQMFGGPTDPFAFLGGGSKGAGKKSGFSDIIKDFMGSKGKDLISGGFDSLVGGASSNIIGLGKESGDAATQGVGALMGIGGAAKEFFSGNPIGAASSLIHTVGSLFSDKKEAPRYINPLMSNHSTQQQTTLLQEISGSLKNYQPVMAVDSHFEGVRNRGLNEERNAAYGN